jgi:hypothetical protein
MSIDMRTVAAQVGRQVGLEEITGFGDEIGRRDH